MFLVNFILIFLILTCALAKRAPITIQVNTATSFCAFLPPHPGDEVGATEEQGKAFCTSADLSNDGRVFPSGFIKAATSVETSSYVQVTGRIDRSKYNLHSSDGGGQYDHRDIDGVTCNEYKYWVNLLEPDVNHFCIRCCKYERDCNIGISTLGCERVIPGDYT